MMEAACNVSYAAVTRQARLCWQQKLYWKRACLPSQTQHMDGKSSRSVGLTLFPQNLQRLFLEIITTHIHISPYQTLFRTQIWKKYHPRGSHWHTLISLAVSSSNITEAKKKSKRKEEETQGEISKALANETNNMEYLIRLAQMHETFRRPELEALAVLHNVDLEILEYSDEVCQRDLSFQWFHV
jgi:hypothetical protein